MIYKGEGGSWSPNVPLVEAMISNRLKDRGFAGSRERDKSIFGSIQKKQALGYTKSGSDEELKVVLPQVSSVVSWSPSVVDMVLDLGTYLSKSRWDGPYNYKGKDFRAIMLDIAGDIGVMETYLSLGRQKNKIGLIIDGYLDTIEIKEIVVKENVDLMEVLEGHTGEVWVTGVCILRDYISEMKMRPEDENQLKI